MRALVVFLLVSAIWLGPPLVPPTQASGCQVAPVFQPLYHDLGQAVGRCAGRDVVRANGDAVQPLVSGLLVWRKADNGAAFTDGRQTWLLGPDGLQKPANAAKFAWEVSVWDGSSVTFAYEEHAQVLLGYDGKHVLVGDVGYHDTHGQFLSVWSVADFQAAYGVLHQMAIIL